MTVGELKKLLTDTGDDLPVFFRCLPPVCGNIEEVGTVTLDTYGFFGKNIPCVIIDQEIDSEE